MTGRRYHDFVLFTDDPEVGPDGTLAAFTVRVFESPAGEGERKERVPITDYAELGTRRAVLGQRSLSAAGQMKLGQRLADLLLPPYARQLFWNSLSELGPEEGLRLRLRLINPLAHLPWEYAYLQGAGSRPGPSNFLALNPRISIVRHEALAIPPQRIPPGDTRRIFVAMATPGPYDRYRLLADLPDEQRQIREALAKVAGIELQCRPNYAAAAEPATTPEARLEQIQADIRELEQVDIFHFSGHGHFEPEAQMTAQLGRWEGTGYIVLANEENRAVFISGGQLAEMLREHGIRLVTLGACETAMTDSFDAWSSVAGALLKGRIPCVVAMQFRVQSELATAFMAAVYEALVAGRTIDEAVFQGRAAMRARSSGALAKERDWGTPVLYSRVPGGHIFPPLRDERARQQAQQSMERRENVHQTWWAWMDSGATASRSQLRTLAAAEELELQPVQTLVLLRSAVVEEEPVEPWLARLREEGVELVRALDRPDRGEGPGEAQTWVQEGGLLGLDQVAGDRPAEVGAVAWAAASHPELTARQTAALALAALPPVPDAGLEQLDRALDGVAPRWRRFARKAELRGTLADGDASVERRNAGLPPWDRAGIWGWRFWRRARRDRERIRALVWGGALGAGMALGTLRGLLGIPAGPLAVTRFAINLFWGALLGAAVGLGAGLAKPMLVGREAGPVRKAGVAGTSRRAALLALVLSTLLFGVMHGLVGWFNGLNLGERSLILATGALLGLGLNLALYGLGEAAGGDGRARWLLRLAAAALPAVLAQALILATGHDWAATAITRTGAHIRDNFGRYGGIFRLIDAHQELFSYLDAALVGILLAAGIGLGWRMALTRRPGVGAPSPSGGTAPAGRRR